MRKHLLLCLSLCITLLSNAAPWDIFKPQAKVVDKEVWANPFKTSSFTDPYVTNCGAYIISPNYMPNYAVQIQVTFDQSVPVPYYVVVSVYGVWTSQPGGASEKLFTILFPTEWSYKSVNFHLNPTEEVYTENTYVYDYGEQ